MWHLGHGGGVDLGSHQWGLHFSSFRIKVWWGGAQMVATASSLIKFPVFGPILVATRSLWELCGSQEGDPWSFIGDYSFFLISGTDAVFLDLFYDFPSSPNNVRAVQRGAAAAARRRHGLEVEDKGHLKYFIVILFFVEVFYIV
jgi:hypothetical protein